jgi:hypothetical protein
MRFTTQTSDGRAVTHQQSRSGSYGARALLAGETLTVTAGQPVAALTVTETDRSDASVPIVAGGTISNFEGPGEYHMRVELADGTTASMRLVVCEPACLDALPAKQRSGGAEIDKRLMADLLARDCEWFSGRAADLCGRSLSAYGA